MNELKPYIRNGEIDPNLVEFESYPRNMLFYVKEGLPALPLKDWGKFWHVGWDIPTYYAIDANNQCWMDNYHGGAMFKTTTKGLIGEANEQGENEVLRLGAILGLETEEVVCPCCKGTGKTKRLKGY